MRILSQTFLLKPLSRKLKDLDETLPADCQDAQSAPRPPITFATWMRNWEPITPLQTLRPLLTIPPTPNHPILLLSTAFKNTIKENRIYALKALSKQFIHQLETNLEFTPTTTPTLPPVTKSQRTSSMPTTPVAAEKKKPFSTQHPTTG